MTLSHFPLTRQDGESAMALDRAMLKLAAERGLGSLRLYRFKPVTVSLGRFQKSPPERWRKHPCVTRPTGGRAVLHDGDVILSLSAVCKGPFAGGLLTRYRCIGLILQRAYRAVGEEVELAPGSPKGASELCYNSASRYELLRGGRKTAGVAQAVERGAFLAQCSLFTGARPEELAAAVEDAFRGEGFRLVKAPLSALREAAPA